MSGHSKWSTIKHKKAMMDNRRGQVFTKLGRAIAIAAREGGDDPETNFKLRLAVDKAREFNMPKANIERAISRGAGGGDSEALTEVVYEGYGPSKMAVMVEVVTDNKNRSVAEVKKIFDKGGGVMGQSGSVNYLFSRLGRIMVGAKGDEAMLKIMDLGVEEVEEGEEGLEVLVKANQLAAIKDKIDSLGYPVKQAELVYEPKSLMELEGEAKEKAVKFLERLDDLDDVQNVYTNLNV